MDNRLPVTPLMHDTLRRRANDRAASLGDVRNERARRKKRYNEREIASKRYTPLMIAVRRRRPATEVAVRAAADPTAIDASDYRGRTALWMAAVSGQFDSVRVLVSLGARVAMGEGSPLSEGVAHVLAANGMAEVLRAIFPPSDPPSRARKPEALGERNVHGLTPLLCAIARPLEQGLPDGYAVSAEALLAAGADPDEGTPEFGFSGLHLCARDGGLACADVLLRHGARIDARKQDGFTPLHLAALNGHAEVVRLLLLRGADPELRTPGGTPDGNATAAQLAESRGRDDIARIISFEIAERSAARPPSGANRIAVDNGAAGGMTMAVSVKLMDK